MIKVSTNGLDSLIKQLDPKQVTRAIRAGNKLTGKSGLVVAKREIASAYNIKVGDAAKRLSVVITGANSAWLKVRSNSRARLALIEFKARMSKRSGVNARILRSGGKASLRHAFIATMPSGHRGVYMRVQGSKKIVEVKTIDIAQMAMAKKVSKIVEARILETGADNISKELMKFIKGRR